MKIIWDATLLTMYPVAKPGFHGGTEMIVNELARRLANKGHSIHVVAPDLELEEQRGPTEWWWPKTYHPCNADVVIMTQQVLPDTRYEADKLVLLHTGCDPYLGSDMGWAQAIDAWPVFSETHKKLLLQERPMIPEDRVHIVGLGVNLQDYSSGYVGTGDRDFLDHVTVKHRLLYANDPMRGLFYLLDIFDEVRKKIPDATLHIAYDFDRQFAVHQWEHMYKGQLVWEMKRRIKNTSGIRNLGALSREDLIAEQLECQVHCMPSDPPNLGTQTHGITQMECAAAGAALVLSDVEAFPEVFGDAATIMPVVGRFIPEWERRITARDYADVVIELMIDKERWREASLKARALAEQNTWDKVADRWINMLLGVCKGVPVG